MKWDGVRAVVYLDRGDLRVLTRNDREVSRTYPELQRARRRAGRGTGSVLDGELVAFDEAGRPSFGELQNADARAGARPRPARPGAGEPAGLRPAAPRRRPASSRCRTTSGARLLESLELAGSRWAVPPAFDGQAADALAVSRAQGLEGVLAKRHDSPYLPGRRSPTWTKVKHLRMQEVVVGGWSPGQGRREGGIGSLLLGVPDERGAADLRRPRRHRVLRPRAGRPRRAAASGRGRRVAVRRAGAADARPPRALGASPRLVGEVASPSGPGRARCGTRSWRGLRAGQGPVRRHPRELTGRLPGAGVSRPSRGRGRSGSPWWSRGRASPASPRCCAARSRCAGTR